MVVYIIKEAFYIEFYYKVESTLLHSFIDFCDSVFHGPIRSESIAVIAKFGLTYRFHDLLDALLHKSVPNTRDSKGSHVSVGLWYFYPSYRFWPVAMFAAC